MAKKKTKNKAQRNTSKSKAQKKTNNKINMAFAAAAVIVFIAIVAVALVNPFTSPAEDVNEIFSKSILASKDVSHYLMDFDILANLTMESGMEMSLEIPITGHVSVDAEEEKMYFYTETKMPFGLTESQESEMYIISNNSYTQTPEYGWIRTELSPDFWDAMGTQDPSTYFSWLQSSELTLEGVEMLNGEETYVINAVPDMEDVKLYLLESVQNVSTVPIPPDSLDSLFESVKGLYLKLWIAKDDYMNTRISFISEFDFDMGELAEGLYPEGSNIAGTLSISADVDYDTKPDIVLPEDAKGAKTTEELMAEFFVSSAPYLNASSNETESYPSWTGY